jgi:ferritin-like metal-binding protein YciE
LVKTLPELIEASESLTLKLVLEAHMELTKGHADRLREVLDHAGQGRRGEMSKAMKGLIEEVKEVIGQIGKCPARDNAIISVMKLVERYEIVGYQTACENDFGPDHAKILGSLNETLDEERSMYLHLNELAQGMNYDQSRKKSIKC